ncbi:hypothetical protein [Rufibacter roseus]|uniref:Uncharacterized protein n=1 Tax=Rufibacter roseus TaxID=1567108 RepID=A0ABW2DLX4_9BACT|nr:hypothetical protein [Rufibacter roseus]
MKKLLLLSFSLLPLFTSCQSSGANESGLSEEQEKERALRIVKAELKVLDATVTDADVLYVGVKDDGTRRDGYAEYLCQLMKDSSTTVSRVKVVKVGSHNDPAKDNAYGILLGEAWCR